MSTSLIFDRDPGVKRRHARTIRELRAVRLGAVTMLAAGVAHEVNNPLAFVTANVLMLGQGIELCARVLRGELLGAAEREDLEFLLAEGPQLAQETSDGCARIGQVVRRLAAFTEDGGEQRVDLHRVVADVMQVLRSGLGPRLELEVELAEVPALRGNPARLAHAFFAFIEHARDIGAGPGAALARVGVRLLTSALGAAVVAEVWDAGPLMTPAQAAIFDDPFQASGPDRTVALGLALAREIVREHGGTVVLAATAAGGNLRRLIFPVTAR